MRLQFGIDDEDAAVRVREELVERFASWLGEQRAEPSADEWDVSSMLDWKWSYGDMDYGTWTRADVDEFLLEHLPRKLSAPAEAAATFPASIAAFARFLEAEGLLGEHSDPADVIAARARAQERAFLDAMDDPSRFGMAKRLWMSASLSDDEPPSEEALAEAMDAFNALPFEERCRLLGVDDHAPVRPPIDLPALPLRAFPDEAQLTTLANEVPLLRQVDALHAAIGPGGMKLTKAGNPTLADGRRLSDALGVDTAIRDIRTAAELPALFAIGRVGLLAGALAHDGKRMQADPDWSGLSAPQRWEAIVGAVLEAGAATLQFGAAVPMPMQLAAVADAVTMHYLALLWLADEPIPVDTFVGVVEELASLAPLPPSGLSRAFRSDMARARVDEVLSSLVDAGLVAVEPEGVTLRAAGAAMVAEFLAGAGSDVVRPGDVAAMPVREIVDLIAGRDDEPSTVLRLWSATRPPGEIAEQIVADLIADPGPSRVLAGFALLECLGADAHDAVLRARDSAIGPQAWMYLAAAGVVADADVPREAVIEGFVNTFLGMADSGSPADIIESMLEGQSIAEQPRFVDDLARSGHPRAGELLELIGRHNPDRRVAKHARKAAHRWRSSHGRS